MKVRGRMKLSIRYSFFTLILALLTSCGAGQKGQLIGDYTSVNNCPASGCADSAASTDKITMASDASEVKVKATDRSVEIAGDCYASTFPSHIIEVAVNGSVRSPASINFGSSASILKCSMGRYNLFLNACDTPAAGRYNVTLKMKPMNEAGQYVEADGNVVNMTYIREVAAAGCP